MLTAAENAHLSAVVEQERAARRLHRQPYAESELQTYVERNFVAQLGAWLNAPGEPVQLAQPVKLLGAQVPCATGVIDLLASLGDRLVIVELKAQPVGEKVIGQVARYRAAIQFLLERMYFLPNGEWAANAPAHHVLSLVIGPSFEPSAAATLEYEGWAFVADRRGPGDFVITPYTGPLPQDLDDKPLRSLLYDWTLRQNQEEHA